MTKNKNNEKWLDEIRSSLADYKEDVPADGWEQYLESRKVLETNHAIGYRRFSIFMRSAAALLLIVIALGSFYKYIGNKEAELVADLPQIAEAVNIEDSSESGEVLVQNDTPIVSEFSYAKSMQEGNHQRIKKDNAPSVENVESQAVVNIDDQNAYESKAAEISEDKVVNSENIINSEEWELLLAMEQNAAKKNTSSRDLSFKMRLGAGGDRFNKLGSSFDSSVRDRDMSYSGSMESAYMAFGCMSDGDSTKISNTGIFAQKTMSQLQDEDVVIDAGKHMSWSFGFEVQKSLTERLSLESGIVYTLLTSDVRMKYSGVKKQQMHYLGVPLKLNVEFAKKDNWLFYTGGGGMLERCIYATRGGKSFSDKDWQWSIVGAVGFQYMLSRHIGIYFEPGVVYYFDNHSGIQNYRSAQPCTFNLQAGLKLR